MTGNDLVLTENSRRLERLPFRKDNAFGLFELTSKLASGRQSSARKGVKRLGCLMELGAAAVSRMG
jgi:hypothetical protein